MNIKQHLDRPRRDPIYDEYIVIASMLTQFRNGAAIASKKMTKVSPFCGMAGMHRKAQ